MTDEERLAGYDLSNLSVFTGTLAQLENACGVRFDTALLHLTGPIIDAYYDFHLICIPVGDNGCVRYQCNYWRPARRPYRARPEKPAPRIHVEGKARPLNSDTGFRDDCNYRVTV